MKESIGFEGDCYNNAMAESLFAMSETGLIDRQPRPRFRSKVEANREIFCYNEMPIVRAAFIHDLVRHLCPTASERCYFVYH